MDFKRNCLHISNYQTEYLQSVKKYLAKNKKSQQNWTNPENFHACTSFDCYCQKLISGMKTGH